MPRKVGLKVGLNVVGYVLWCLLCYICWNYNGRRRYQRIHVTPCNELFITQKSNDSGRYDGSIVHVVGRENAEVQFAVASNDFVSPCVSLVWGSVYEDISEYDIL